MMVRKLGVLVAGVALMAAAACGSSSGGSRPSADDVSKSLQTGKASEILGSAGSLLNKQAYDCIAKAIVDSKLSNGAVRALVNGDKKYKESGGDDKALTGLQADIAKCAEAAVTGAN